MNNSFINLILSSPKVPSFTPRSGTSEPIGNVSLFDDHSTHEANWFDFPRLVANFTSNSIRASSYRQQTTVGYALVSPQYTTHSVFAESEFLEFAGISTFGHTHGLELTSLMCHQGTSLLLKQSQFVIEYMEE